MTRENMLTAIHEGIPFEIKMADGEKYRVNEAAQIAVGKTAMIVIDEKDDQPHWLPLLTVTGVSYLGKTTAAGG